MIKYKRFFK